MPLGAKRLWVIQSLSLLRLIAALLFASVAFQDVPAFLPATVYVVAMVSDLIDGYLARRLHASTFFGKILDLTSDKSLTIVSLLYAAARGVSVFPLGIIATREVISLGMRSIVVDGRQLLSTNRVFGGLMAGLLWSNTLFLVLTDNHQPPPGSIGVLYDVCACIFALNLTVRVWRARSRIRVSLGGKP